MFDLIWDLIQQSRISNLQSEADSARAASRTTDARVAELERTVESLTLMTMALGELLAQKGVVSSEEIEARVRDIDLSDGKLDGRVATSPRVCRKCGRMIAGDRVNCLYCGVLMDQDRP
ncbi:MAG: hypothetical protein JNL50_01970 [Phycisphaerae bacterium]|nr:hypothetical protein [Phycisphaerae bacterium]